MATAVDTATCLDMSRPSRGILCTLAFTTLTNTESLGPKKNAARCVDVRSQHDVGKRSQKNAGKWTAGTCNSLALLWLQLQLRLPPVSDCSSYYEALSCAPVPSMTAPAPKPCHAKQVPVNGAQTGGEHQEKRASKELQHASLCTPAVLKGRLSSA